VGPLRKRSPNSGRNELESARRHQLHRWHDSSPASVQYRTAKPSGPGRKRLKSAGSSARIWRKESRRRRQPAEGRKRRAAASIVTANAGPARAGPGPKQTTPSARREPFAAHRSTPRGERVARLPGSARGRTNWLASRGYVSRKFQGKSARL
jgi:hypothetical protein